MKNLILVFVMLVASTVVLGDNHPTPIKRTTCKYYNIIPNSPEPWVVMCKLPARAGCGGYCQAHCGGKKP